jgi:hypothetical protein
MKFQKKFDIFWYIFFENLAFIWPFSPFDNLAFFETADGQIWPFLFLRAWQSCHT